MADSKVDLGRVSRKRGKRKKMSGIKAVSIILAVAVVIYLVAAVFVSVHNNLSTTVARSGSVRETVRTVGYVFRQQSIITSPSGGYLECIATEGERVKEGQVLGYVYETKPDAAIMEEIKNLHKMIRSRGLDAESSVYTSSPATAEKRISELSREMSDMRRFGDLSRIEKIIEEINSLVLRKQSGADIQETVSTKEQLEAELNSLLGKAGGGHAVVATTGGVFSTRIDGLEDELAYDNAMLVTPAYLEALSTEEEKLSEIVTVGQPICKIVNNYNWYFAAVMDEEEIQHIKEGQSIQMELFELSDAAVKGTVRRISDVENGKCAVVISTNRYADGVYSSSEVEADIVLVSSSGIKLPTQCLHVKDGVTGVYVLRLDVAKFVPVNVRYRNDEWTIVDSVESQTGGAKLQIYDEVIVSCRNLEDGKIIR
ncbi:MAG: HlyD family efflux transporter periplasmic adaptor subunit [Clostridia bacterium]|nr:HlyD family efflux transporter periplasmic adaptor subunit [Clostridia bacterium]